MKKEYNNMLQGMEHLKKEINNEQNQNNVAVSQQDGHKLIKIELMQIIIIMVVLFGAIAALVFINNSTGFLQNIAEAIDNWV